MRGYVAWLIFFRLCFKTECWVTEERGEETTVLPVDCDFHLTDPSGQIHSLGFEEGLKYPVNTECNWLITVDESSTIVLQFHHMFLEYHAECIYDFVQVKEGDIHYGNYCGSSLPAPIMSLTNSLFVHFYSDATVKDFGFNATYTSQSGLKLCEAIRTNITGKFGPVLTDSHHFYGNKVHCAWKIVSLSLGKRVQLYFTRMDIPANDNCEQFYIQIIDFNTSVGVYCGNVQLPVITSTYGAMSVDFLANESVSAKGFEALYIITDEDFLYGEILTEPNGKIQSPDRDNDGLYDSNLYCYWIMIGPEGTNIQLDFTYVSIEPYLHCWFDAVTVYDSEETFKALLAEVCGTDKPSIRSTTNIVKVKFLTNPYKEYSGFIAEYSHHFKGLYPSMKNSVSPVTAQSDSSTPPAVTPTFSLTSLIINFAVSINSTAIPSTANMELTSVQQTRIHSESQSSSSATETATQQGDEVPRAVGWNTSTLLNETEATPELSISSLEPVSNVFTGEAIQHTTTLLKRSRFPIVGTTHRPRSTEMVEKSTESINQTTTNMGESTRNSIEPINQTTMDTEESKSSTDLVNAAITTQQSRKMDISTYSVDISSTFNLNTAISTNTDKPLSYFSLNVVCIVIIFL